MSTLLAAIVFLVICIAAMCIGIIVRGEGGFPQGEISKNEKLRSKGIRCMNEEEGFGSMGDGCKREGKTFNCGADNNASCAGCSFNPSGKGT